MVPNTTSICSEIHHECDSFARLNTVTEMLLMIQVFWDALWCCWHKNLQHLKALKSLQISETLPHYNLTSQKNWIFTHFDYILSNILNLPHFQSNYLNFHTINEASTYCPWGSMARLCKGCWWHSILDNGSLTFGLHIVTMPNNIKQIFIKPLTISTKRGYESHWTATR